MTDIAKELQDVIGSADELIASDIREEAEAKAARETLVSSRVLIVALAAQAVAKIDARLAPAAEPPVVTVTPAPVDNDVPEDGGTVIEVVPQPDGSVTAQPVTEDPAISDPAPVVVIEAPADAPAVEPPAAEPPVEAVSETPPAEAPSAEPVNPEPAPAAEPNLNDPNAAPVSGGGPVVDSNGGDNG